VDDNIRAAARDFAVDTAAILDRLLRLRIDGFSARAQRVELAAALASLLSVYLFVGFYRSVAGPIRRIVATLNAVAAGDLTQRVSVDTHDELSYVAKALNDTVAKTEVATERLAIQAAEDTLTALPNRSVALTRLSDALTRTAKTDQLMAVLFIDLDRFKVINDSFGHEGGDQVLCAVAGRLTSLSRGSDTVARLAGDEFVVISEDLPDPDAAVRFAERTVELLSRPIVISCGAVEREVIVGASVGIAYANGGMALTPEDLLRDADVAMYRAKQRGRGCVEIFDDTLRVAVERRLGIEYDLRRGIDTGQLRVHYQPIVDGQTGRMRGVEALARWQHPEHGLLQPVDFIDIACETGLIVPLGAEVLAVACAQVARWRAEWPEFADLHIAVNVAGSQFEHPAFVPTVAAVLAQSGLDPDALWLEITETSIMADAAAAGVTLHAIRALGVHLAIDDFGTGYSSLTHLRRFPVEALKIDRSFVAGVGRDREDDAIVDMILSLAKALDLHVVAEGVETAAQRDQLNRLGCDYLQGYHLGRPVDAEQITAQFVHPTPAYAP
jgi:diguanylate cyclase (GGDEF)-like protein